MQLIESARTQLEPLARAIMKSLDDGSQPDAAGFFGFILVCLAAMRDEEDLANLFVELSTTAFRGYQFSAEQAGLIDELLATAEAIAFAMTAPNEDAH